jgi:hypothetical protein
LVFAGIAAARRKFTPEFINRLDNIVVFKSLGAEELRGIVDIELEMVQQRIQGVFDTIQHTRARALRKYRNPLAFVEQGVAADTPFRKSRDWRVEAVGAPAARLGTHGNERPPRGAQVPQSADAGHAALESKQLRSAIERCTSLGRHVGSFHPSRSSEE